MHHPRMHAVYRVPCVYSKTGDWIEDSDEEIAELDRREAAAEAAEQARLATLVPSLTLRGETGAVTGTGTGTPEGASEPQSAQSEP